MIICDPAVGKTQILSRAPFNKFDIESKPTPSVDLKKKDETVDNQTVRTNLRYTAGQERYRAIHQTSYPNSKGAILVFGIIRKETLSPLSYGSNPLGLW